LVQGTGNVGSHLIEMLVKENASVFVSDIYEEKLKEISLMRKNLTPTDKAAVSDMIEKAIKEAEEN
jgi:Trk K+ transport system NAD-binding subunit